MNYIGAREGVPAPTKPYERAGRAEWVVCGCGHKGLPGGFHVHLEPSTEPIPEPAPKPEPKPEKQGHRTKRCNCGTLIYPQSTQCVPCSAKRRGAERRGAA